MIIQKSLKQPIVQQVQIPDPLKFPEEVVRSEVGKIEKTKWNLKVACFEWSPAQDVTLKSIGVQTLESDHFDIAEFSIPSPNVLRVEAVIYNKQFLPYVKAISEQYKSTIPADFVITKRW